MDQPIDCMFCDSGMLQPRRVYRRSRTVVLIGYILLAPLVLGIVARVFGRMTAITGAGQAVPTEQALRDAGVPENVAQHVLEGHPVPTSWMRDLTTSQRALINPRGGRVVAIAFGSVFAVASLISGLLGCLLVMKKRVLRCSNCRAVAPAA